MEHGDMEEAMRVVGETQGRLAERMHWPFWRHLVVGLMLGAMLIGIALPFNMQVLISIGVIGMAFWLMHDDKKRYGMFVSGFQRGRTVWVIVAMTVMFLGAMLTINIFVDAPLRDPLFWGLVGAVVVATTALSVIWQRIYRADLLAGRA